MCKETNHLTPQVISKLIARLPEDKPDYICAVLRDIAKMIEEKEKATSVTFNDNRCRPILQE